MTLGRGNQSRRKLPKKRQTVNAAKLSQQRNEQRGKNKMLLPGMKPYEIQMIKDTPTGMRYLVRHNTYGKYIICSSVSETGNSITNPETTGQYDYVMKKWQKLVGKYVPTP